MSANVLHVSHDGPAVTSGADALGLIYEGGADEAEWIAAPVSRLAPSFFDLHSGLAGEVVQKFANYRVGLVVVGDVTEHLAASAAFRDFVHECNRGRQVWFVSDEADFGRRLRAPGTT